MFPCINVFAVSGGNAVLEKLGKLLKQKRKICLSGYSRNYSGGGEVF